MNFDKSSVYESEIKPIVENLRAVCSSNDLPMFISVGVANDENDTKYINEAVFPSTHNLEITNDIIPLLVNVTLGFKTVLPVKETEIVFDVDTDGIGNVFGEDV